VLAVRREETFTTGQSLDVATQASLLSLEHLLHQVLVADSRVLPSAAGLQHEAVHFAVDVVAPVVSVVDTPAALGVVVAESVAVHRGEELGVPRLRRGEVEPILPHHPLDRLVHVTIGVVQRGDAVPRGPLQQHSPHVVRRHP